jgi:hypothetical protein
MSSTRLFFQFEVPYKFALAKKKELINITLEKIKYGSA